MEDDFQTTQMSNPLVGRRTYLITYAQAEKSKFPTRESFGKMIEFEFNRGTGKIKTDYWACCEEDHDDHGTHYHVSLKLTGPKKWLSIKKNITSAHNITLNFSDKHNHYIAAYRYVCKTDKNVLHSQNHPDLTAIGSPRTKNSTIAYREKRKQQSVVDKEKSETERPSSSTSQKKKKRLSAGDISDLLVRKNIKRETELYAIAKSRKLDGEKDVWDYVLSKTSKSINELIDTTWKMEGSHEVLSRERLTRIDLLRMCLSESCANECTDKVWLKSAVEVISNNKYHPYVFAAALRDLLTKGRGKYRNIFIYGPANCAKTFLLKPLELIYRVFLNPSRDKYGWIGADDAEVIVMQDLRYSSESIAWKDFLLLLEGEVVKLPAPKNQYASDVVIQSDTPIFATGKSELVYSGKFNSSDDRETEMMSVRWKYFQFTHQIAECDQKRIEPCKRCFAELVFMGEL